MQRDHVVAFEVLLRELAQMAPAALPPRDIVAEQAQTPQCHGSGPNGSDDDEGDEAQGEKALTDVVGSSALAARSSPSSVCSLPTRRSTAPLAARSVAATVAAILPEVFLPAAAMLRFSAAFRLAFF